MARNKGTLPISANFEPQIAEPFDGRQRVPTLAELVLAATWTAKDGNIYTYIGMPTVVYNDGANNGFYYLNAADYTVANNWIKVGSGASITPISTTFAGSILLDNFMRDYGQVIMSSNLTIGFTSTGKTVGSKAVIILVGNGTNIYSLSNFKSMLLGETTEIDNTLNMANEITFTLTGSSSIPKYQITDQYLIS